ncbi:MAG: chemotaxis protein CheW [Rubrivivax sp.]|nr:chemotaxis protein CheW [Rubrivivax sp.]
MTEATGIDLTQFHQAFFEEAGENLARMEQLLLALDPASADTEELNAIFRCAHSVKGGAAAFGFACVAGLTHQMESLLDRLRRGELAPSAPMIDTLLQAGDTLKLQLARHAGAGDDAPDTAELVARMQALGTAPAAPGPRQLLLTLGPLQDPTAVAGLVDLFTEIVDLGRIEALDDAADAEGLRRFKVSTACSDAELLDLCSFQVDRALLRLAPLPAPEAPAPAPPRPAPRAVAGHAEPATLRVSVDKVDQLINLVGELVITQSMLLQSCASLDAAAQLHLSGGLSELQRHTHDLQEAAMSIRMIPMSTVFSRFPRMLRDLADKTGKKLELVLEGEAIELDKGMTEKIADPLLHLVRNSCDHGIELPAERLALGKPEAGTVTLAASHQGGTALIEVRDDGRGLSRARLLAKARERGLLAPDSLSDAEVWSLIFAPGFSTAETVTDVSGRGVGMDVVQKNIAALGGTVEIASREGQGMSVRVHLPLTLAIMDSMSVRIADECYVLPLAAVVESFRFTPAQIRTLGGQAQLVRLREEYLPVLDLERLLDVPRAGGERAQAVMVVLEAGGVRVAARVDELLGQQQVVVKSLEANCGPVDHVSGATILGDGRVALILDVAALVRQATRGSAAWDIAGNAGPGARAAAARPLAASSS